MFSKKDIPPLIQKAPETFPLSFQIRNLAPALSTSRCEVKETENPLRIAMAANFFSRMDPLFNIFSSFLVSLVFLSTFPSLYHPFFYSHIASGPAKSHLRSLIVFTSSSAYLMPNICRPFFISPCWGLACFFLGHCCYSKLMNMTWNLWYSFKIFWAKNSGLNLWHLL